MRWKFWEEWPDWPESRGYVLTREDEIVAHGAVVPLTCLWEDRKLKVIRLIDWAAEAKSVGSGVALMKLIGPMSDAVMAVGGTEMTLKIFRALGEETRCGPLICPATTAVPPDAGQKNAGWRTWARLARGLLWSCRAPSVVPAAGPPAGSPRTNSLPHHSPGPLQVRAWRYLSVRSPV